MRRRFFLASLNHGKSDVNFLPKRVTVLRGGPSAERSVSFESGAAVAAACRQLRWNVFEADIGPGELSALDEPTDVVFPVLHGAFGEDGELQAILESRQLRFIGSDSRASKLAMNKPACKSVWREAGLPTPDWRVITAEEFKKGIDIASLPDAPVVLKPVAEGSSLGVRLCDNRSELLLALEETVLHYSAVLIEKLLVGPELTVGILGTSTLPIIQIKPATRFYDYEAKYHRDDTAYLFDPQIKNAVYKKVQELSLLAFNALGCRDFARVDFILDETGGPQLLEINTIPGFTSHSLLPKAAAHIGLNLDTVVGMLLEMALNRNEEASNDSKPMQTVSINTSSPERLVSPESNRSQSYLLSDANVRATELRRLEQQAKLLFDFEIEGAKSAGFIPEGTVVDLGCGSGCWTTLLAKAESSLNIIGIDRNSALLTEANRYGNFVTHLADVGSESDLKDLLEQYQPSWAVLRFVLQHMNLKERRALLRELYEQQVKIICIDTDDRYLRFDPPSPALEALAKQVKCKQGSRGGNREIGSEISSELTSIGYRTTRSSLLDVNSESIGNNEWWSIFWPVLFSGQPSFESADLWTGQASANGLNITFNEAKLYYGTFRLFVIVAEP